jgi:hypothetical protein
MIKYHLTTRRCQLNALDERALERELERLSHRLVHFSPDLVHLFFNVEKHPRRPEYAGSFRLVVLNRSLPARRNRAPTISALIRRAFDDIEEQLDRFKAKLRHEDEFASARPR